MAHHLFADIKAGKRRGIAKAITLVESDLSQDRKSAESLLTEIMPHTGGSVRIGISGSPGVGKSTFIEAFGQLLISEQKKVAVLAVDPTSPVSGGSILGDKTRMEDLVKSELTFVRPSPSKGSLGGVCRRTREAMLICEAAGYDYILVETVGVGQSEIAVASMVDVFLMLQLPNAGDELQGIKKGILEKADIVVVTKADGEHTRAAERTRLEQQRALQLVRHDDAWHPPVLATSALEGAGLAEVLGEITRCYQLRQQEGTLARMRQEQARDWFEQELIEGVRDWLAQRADLQDQMDQLQEQVLSNRLPASAAVRQLFGQI